MEKPTPAHYWECEPLQIQEFRADVSNAVQVTSAQRRIFAVGFVLLSGGLAGILIAMHYSGAHLPGAPQRVLIGEDQTQLVWNRGKDCWRPCGEIGGDCPGFCGAGNACCRRYARHDPPECHGITDFWRHHHHECVAPLRYTPVKHQGQPCLKYGCGISGDCAWCGAGNACCKKGATSDPPECANVNDFRTDRWHTCVAPVENLPVKHQGQNCWAFCNGRPGPCGWCGTGNLCCRYGSSWDGPECRKVSYFPTRKYHTCVKPGWQPTGSSTTAPFQRSTTIPQQSTTTLPLTSVSALPQSSTAPPTQSSTTPEMSSMPASTAPPAQSSTTPQMSSMPAITPQPISTSQTTVKPFPTFPPPATPQTFTFHMYRAQNNENYPFENVNAGNIAGVLRYLHDEVVIACPRKFQITRILRFKVTMRTTDTLFSRPPHVHFGPYVAFDKGQCTVPKCSELWAKYGYAVGCQKQGTSVAQYSDGVWYSVPGPCPSEDFRNKSLQCRQQEPGGQCPMPDGSHTCTWHAEAAGDISLDDLTGIQNYNGRCAEGLIEYNPRTNNGSGTFFWNGKQDPTSCSQRQSLVLLLFKARYPQIPQLPDPECDWWR